ncbi:MAG: hypothetical protein ABGY96_04935 [bacterium]|nr:hypothetical protein [Gammaproteobacteria bacterium]HIL95273.1 hypothetical protein [Pseudomonadales bacterium]
MVRITTLSIAALLFSASVPVGASEDSRYYQLLNRLSKVESDVVDLRRLRARVSQLEVIDTQHERTMEEQSRRIATLEQKNEDLEAIVSSLCKQVESEHQERSCGSVDETQTR